MKEKQTLLIGGVFLVGVIVIGAWLATRRMVTDQLQAPQPTPVPVAPGEAAAPEVDIGTSQQAFEQARETATLSDVAGGSATGMATRSFDGETFLVTVAASVSAPPAGQYYEGWLVSEVEQPSYLSLGRLDPFAAGQYAGVYSVSRPLLAHDQVVVTLETMDDGRPETHVLEGNF